jgi:hypothetical protein
MNLENDDHDVVIAKNNDKTNVKLTALADDQEVTVSQEIDGDNRLAPTFNSRGDISLEWERRLSDDSCLTANLRPNESSTKAWMSNGRTPISTCPLTDPVSTEPIRASSATLTFKRISWLL